MKAKINPQAILCDLDGTLADSLSVMKQSYCQFLKQFNIEPSDEEFNIYNGPPLYVIVRDLKKNHNISEDEDMLLKKYTDILDQLYFSVKPFSGAYNLINQAKLYSCTFGIVTSNVRSRVNTWLARVGLDRLVDFIVAGDDVLTGKPHPEPYLIASKLTGCCSEGIIVIEDSMSGAISSVSAGLKTFVINDNVNNLWPQGAVLMPSLDCLATQLW